MDGTGRRPAQGRRPPRARSSTTTTLRTCATRPAGPRRDRGGAALRFRQSNSHTWPSNDAASEPRETAEQAETSKSTISLLGSYSENDLAVSNWHGGLLWHCVWLSGLVPTSTSQVGRSNRWATNWRRKPAAKLRAKASLRDASLPKSSATSSRPRTLRPGQMLRDPYVDLISLYWLGSASYSLTVRLNFAQKVDPGPPGASCGAGRGTGRRHDLSRCAVRRRAQKQGRPNGPPEEVEDSA